jgi:hypothetical protein
MGYSAYSAVNYSATKETLAKQTRQEIFQKHAHKSMDPSKVTTRECRDSDIHPETLPIIIALDITGSMGIIPEKIIKGGLGIIIETLMERGVLHPSILFLAIGDHLYDPSPLQIGQFESGDKELVKWLSNTWIVGRGGGNQKESYQLAWETAAYHTVTDAMEKRGRKGILITIGDEGILESDDASLRLFATRPLGEVPSLPSLLKTVQEKWEVYHIHANDASFPVGSWPGDSIFSQWTGLIGENVWVVEKNDNIPMTIVDIVLGSMKNYDNQHSHYTTKTDSADSDHDELTDMHLL